MSKQARHVARICIDNTILLDILDFKGGKVLDIYQDREYYRPNEFYITLEHPDLGKVYPGGMIPIVIPTFKAEYGPNGVIIRIDRIDPIKRHPDKGIEKTGKS